MAHYFDPNEADFILVGLETLDPDEDRDVRANAVEACTEAAVLIGLTKDETWAVLDALTAARVPTYDGMGRRVQTDLEKVLEVLALATDQQG